MKLTNFVIAGTEKAGTTSVFSYLARHPSVAVSARKETNFFRSEQGSLDDYAREFPDIGAATILLEASPAYLGEAETVAPRMHAMIPNGKLLFILREPVDRFVSSYYFHHERLNLPKELGLQQYIDLCLDHVIGQPRRGQDPAASIAPLDDWYLNVLAYGRYARYLSHYFALFPRDQMRVAFFDDLRDNPRQFMQDLSPFFDIDPQFWFSAGYDRMNASFAGRRQWLHRLALLTNDSLEPLLRPRPRLKKALLGFYKSINSAAERDRSLAKSDRRLLEEFYAPSNRDLEALLNCPLPAGWVKAPPRSKVESKALPQSGKDSGATTVTDSGTDSGSGTEYAR